MSKTLENAEIVMKALEAKNADVRILTASLKKMEADLAKVRTAVGELKWKEIVGGPVPT
jgi:hypothetical protein